MLTSIENIPFFQGLSNQELTSIKGCLKEKAFGRGESLFLEGNVCERVFFVRSGRVKLYRTSSSGREQILETLTPGDTCACNPGSLKWGCSSSAVALSPSTVWFLSRDNYVELVKTNMKLSQTLNRLFAERLQCFSSLIEEVSLKDSKKRLIKFLLDMLEESSHESKSSGSLLISFTREELAQRIGAARETVARQLYQLKRKKLINIRPRQIVILNKQGLQKLL